MTKIGIIVAMNKELALMIPLLSNPVEKNINGLVFYEGTVGNKDVVILKCGIGKVNAAIGTVTMIDHFSPNIIINSGVAGGSDQNVNVMDVVVGESVAYHDVWCGPEIAVGAIQGLPLYYKGDQATISLIPKADNIKFGLITSGDQFIDTLEKVQAIKKDFPESLAVDMESGAIAQVCELRKTPFVSIRVISDSPGASHNNTEQYYDFWEDAPKHTFEITHQLIQEL